MADDTRGIALDAAYSLEGLIDFGLSISRSSVDDEILDDPSLTFLSSYLVVHPLKAAADMPISVALEAQFGRGSFGSDALDEVGVDVTGTTIGVGCRITEHVPTSEPTQSCLNRST